MATRRDYELMLTYMPVPWMDGVDVSRLTLAQTTGTTVPIVAKMANSVAAKGKHCMDARMTDFIYRPFYPNDMFAMIIKWLTLEKR